MLKFHFRKLVRNIRYARKIYVWTSKWLSRSVVQKQHFSTYFSDYKSPVTKINVAVNRLPNFLANPNNEKDAKEIQPHHRCTIHLNCENSKLLDEAFKDATKDFSAEREQRLKETLRTCKFYVRQFAMFASQPRLVCGNGGRVIVTNILVIKAPCPGCGCGARKAVCRL